MTLALFAASLAIASIPDVVASLQQVEPLTTTLRIGDIVACPSDADEGMPCEMVCRAEEAVGNSFPVDTHHLSDFSWEAWNADTHPPQDYLSLWQMIRVVAPDAEMQATEEGIIVARLFTASMACVTAAGAYASRHYDISIIRGTLMGTPVIESEWVSDVPMGPVVRSLKMHDLAMEVFPLAENVVAASDFVTMDKLCLGVQMMPVPWFLNSSYEAGSGDCMLD